MRLGWVDVHGAAMDRHRCHPILMLVGPLRGPLRVLDSGLGCPCVWLSKSSGAWALLPHLLHWDGVNLESLSLDFGITAQSSSTGGAWLDRYTLAKSQR